MINNNYGIIFIIYYYLGYENWDDKLSCPLWQDGNLFLKMKGGRNKKRRSK